MNENTNRGLLVAGLCANVLMLALALFDYALADSAYMWPIFVGWAVLILLIVILALTSGGYQVVRTSTTFVRTEPAAPAAAAKPAAPPFKSPAALGPFQYNGYTLYARQVELKGDGGQRTIYFFAKKSPKSGKPAPKPVGFHVGVNERTGLPFLKKGVGKDGEDLTPEFAAAPRPQCVALTNDGSQCRNSARESSKYCASHFGYQPPTQKGLAKRIEGEAWSATDKVSDKSSVRGADTVPKSKKARDTKLSVRKKAAA